MRSCLLFFIFCCSLWFQNNSFGRELIVSAGSSLTDVFGDIIKIFEEENPDLNVILNLGGSGALLQQIYKGAPVDVYASANMQLVEQAISREALVQETVKSFASNQLVLIVPRGNINRVDQIDDLLKDQIKRVAISNYGVPVGRYTIDALISLGQWEQIQKKVINTMSVRQTLAYVNRGEVDAGFVYATDAATLNDGVEIITELLTREKIVYPIGVVKRSESFREAKKFVDFVMSERGGNVLRNYGFLVP